MSSIVHADEQRDEYVVMPGRASRPRSPSPDTRRGSPDGTASGSPR